MSPPHVDQLRRRVNIVALFHELRTAFGGRSAKDAERYTDSILLAVHGGARSGRIGAVRWQLSEGGTVEF